MHSMLNNKKHLCYFIWAKSSNVYLTHECISHFLYFCTFRTSDRLQLAFKCFTNMLMEFLKYKQKYLYYNTSTPTHAYTSTRTYALTEYQSQSSYKKRGSRYISETKWLYAQPCTLYNYIKMIILSQNVACKCVIIKHYLSFERYVNKLLSFKTYFSSTYLIQQSWYGL